MRVNQPVSQHEYDFDDNQLLISRTDLRGNITYANPAFVEVSGFTLNELIGQEHNLVRHPDMPEAAYADFWATIQAGGIWSGIVKNRRKNGDHYWVRANVVPIREGERVVGYGSMRVKPSRHEVALAQQAYDSLNRGETRYTVKNGLVLRRNLPFARFWAGLGDTSWGALALEWLALLVFLVTIIDMAAFDGTWFGQAFHLGALAFGFAVFALVPWWEHRTSRKHLLALKTFTFQIAAGNLTAELPTDVSGDISRLTGALDSMKKGLLSIVRDVHAGIGQVYPAVASIAHSNEDLATRTDSQAAALQQTAASMEQISTTVHNNTQHAQDASAVARTTVAEVGKASEQMNAVVTRMRQISESSSRMKDIISMIDSIAFQTNILAINASIEAARAGDQGKGFAVVAAEVRSLAARSSDAAKEIEGLVEHTTREVDDGMHVVTRAEQAIQNVIRAANQVGTLMSEISSATQEQSLGIGQISQAVNDMDQTVQHNAMQVQEFAQAVRDLKAQTEFLTHAVAAFRSHSQGRELAIEVQV